MIIITGFFPGVYFGAYLADLNGGYKGKALISALTIACFLGGFCTLLACCNAVTFEYYSFVALMWLILFTGAGIIPIG